MWKCLNTNCIQYSTVINYLLNVLKSSSENTSNINYKVIWLLVRLEASSNCISITKFVDVVEIIAKISFQSKSKSPQEILGNLSRTIQLNDRSIDTSSGFFALLIKAVSSFEISFACRVKDLKFKIII